MSIERIGFSGSLDGTQHKVTVSADSLSGPFALLDDITSKYNGT